MAVRARQVHTSSEDKADENRKWPAATFQSEDYGFGDGPALALSIMESGAILTERRPARNLLHNPQLSEPLRGAARSGPII